MDYQAKNQRVIAFLTVSMFYLENWGSMKCEQVNYYVHKLLKTFLILAGTAKSVTGACEYFANDKTLRCFRKSFPKSLQGFVLSICINKL